MARVSALFGVILFVAPATAQPIYQWTDEKGQVHFSTAPHDSKFQAKELPQLGRDDIDRRIKVIKEQTPETCIKHGGLDCTRGADSDGSVICLDGYRDAILPFQFECLEARLQGRLALDVFGEEKNEEATIPHVRNRLAQALKGRVVKSYRLNVRNLSGVAATGVAVDIVLGRKQLYRALGPETIEAYGSAEYSLPLAENNLAPTLAQLEQSEYKVTCTNCGAIMRNQSAQ